MKTSRLLIFAAAICAFRIMPNPIFAQGATAFTYQGQLRDGGTNANGIYTMIFKLYDSSNDGNQIGGAFTTSPTLANGLFTVNLDFGPGAFNAFARWLDITVQSGSDTQTLSPRVQVLPTPYAQFAHTAGSFADMTSTLNNSNVLVSSDNWQGGTIPRSDLTHSFAFSDNGVNQMVLGANGQGATFPFDVHSGGMFYGNGGGLTGLIPNITVFRANGNFLAPANVTKIMVEMWGGGGGGGTGFHTVINNVAYDHVGGGGGAGSYAWGIFAVIPGSNYVITVAAPASAGQDGGTTSIFGGMTGQEVSMSAGGGFAGGSATINGDGNGGDGGAATGGNLINLPGDGGTSNGSGGAIWRGSSGGNVNGGARSGPGGGGGGGLPGNVGSGGNRGGVIIYY